LIYLDPRPSLKDLELAHREEGYDPFLSLEKPQRLFDRAYDLARRLTIAWKRRLIDKLIEPGSYILDGGCGTGEFLSALKDRYKVEGFEPESNAARWAREKLGLSVNTGNLDSLTLPEESFNIVTLWHVLEHIPSPLNDLQHIYRILRPGGLLLIALPNIASFDAKVYRACWVAIDAPRHLWHFAKSQITKLTKKAGFELKRTGMLPLDPFYNILLSECLCNQMKGRGQLGWTLLRMPIAMLGTLVYGTVTGNHSSRYYIFKKEVSSNK